MLAIAARRRPFPVRRLLASRRVVCLSTAPRPDGVGGGAPDRPPSAIVVRQPTATPGFFATLKRYALEYRKGAVLLRRELSLALRLVWRVMGGHSATRSEMRLMKSTATNVFKALPLASVVMMIGFTLTSTVVLRVFPRLLPSTFKGVEELTREGEDSWSRARQKLEVADRIRTMTAEVAESLHHNETLARSDARKVQDVLERLGRADVHVTNEELIAVAPVFQRSIPLEALPRAQLVELCKHFGLWQFALPKGLLVFQLRTTARAIRADDKDIYWEGVSTLSDEEVESACQARGLTRGLHQAPTAVLRNRLKSWIRLSVSRDVPSSLLLCAGAFKMSQGHNEEDAAPGALGIKISLLGNELDELVGRRVALDQEIQHVQDHLKWCRDQQEILAAYPSDAAKVHSLMAAAAGDALPVGSDRALPPDTAARVMHAFGVATGPTTHLSIADAVDCIIDLLPDHYMHRDDVHGAVVANDKGIEGRISMEDFVNAYTAVALEADEEATAHTRAETRLRTLEALEELDSVLAAEDAERAAAAERAKPPKEGPEDSSRQ